MKKQDRLFLRDLLSALSLNGTTARLDAPARQQAARLADELQTDSDEQMRILCKLYELRDVRLPVDSGSVPVKRVLAVLDGALAVESWR